MNAAYLEEVRVQCPQAQIVYDLFHVVARYGRKVIDRVRVDEATRLRHDALGRKLVKGSRWLLLRNYENIEKRDDRVRLKDLLARQPERIIETAVRGMLPKGPLGRAMITKLKVFAGAEHDHQAQQPKVLKI